MSNIKILVVDDSPSFLKSVEEILLAENYLALTASDADSAWAIYQKQLPEIVLTDVNLLSTDASDQSGIELMQKIHHEESNKHSCHVILMSSNVSIKDQLNVYKYGTVDFLAKPFDPNFLLERIASYINTRAEYS